VASEFTIENVGTGATGRLSAVFGGADPGDFSFASNTCAGMSLDVGDTCTVSVEFRPGAEGGSSATLTVGDGDAEATATLEGNGAADAGLAISPTPHNFGDAIIGTPSAPQVFTVTNTGDATSGTINITLSGLDATQFELGADSCSGMTVAAGDDCTVEVIYNPTASGVHMGTLQATASPGSTATAALQGRAASAASVRLLPGSQDFGTVVTGSSSSTVDFTLTNTGGVPTGTISHTFGGADAAEFSVTSSTCAGAPLAGGASCTITVRFNAASAGAKTATLDVTDGTLTASATLSANGVAPGAIVIEPSTRDYGNSSIGVATGATTFTVRNTGGAATGVLTVAVAGTNPADFPIVAGGDGCSGATLAAMGTCTIAVQFNPTAAGARAATLRVQGTPGGTATSALTGTGDAAERHALGRADVRLVVVHPLHLVADLDRRLADEEETAREEDQVPARELVAEQGEEGRGEPHDRADPEEETDAHDDAEPDADAGGACALALGQARHEDRDEDEVVDPEDDLHHDEGEEVDPGRRVVDAAEHAPPSLGSLTVPRKGWCARGRRSSPFVVSARGSGTRSRGSRAGTRRGTRSAPGRPRCA
jgi:hypothetical protein